LAVLGYPKETSIPLDADHYNICKFQSAEDRKYISVKNILKHWYSRLQRPSRADIVGQRCRSSEVEVKHLQTILAIREPSEIDLNVLRGGVLGGCFYG
jgi:hypothetical protein